MPVLKVEIGPLGRELEPWDNFEERVEEEVGRRRRVGRVKGHEVDVMGKAVAAEVAAHLGLRAVQANDVTILDLLEAFRVNGLGHGFQGVATAAGHVTKWEREAPTASWAMGSR